MQVPEVKMQVLKQQDLGLQCQTSLILKGGLTYVVLEPVLSGFETINWPALWEAPSSSMFVARQVSLYN